MVKAATEAAEMRCIYWHRKGFRAVFGSGGAGHPRLAAMKGVYIVGIQCYGVRYIAISSLPIAALEVLCYGIQEDWEQKIPFHPAKAT